MAEWLRRWTANPLGYTRVGSNPILVEWVYLFLFNENVYFRFEEQLLLQVASEDQFQRL